MNNSTSNGALVCRNCASEYVNIDWLDEYGRAGLRWVGWLVGS